ncbi:MAG TPA: hypothetical protein VEH00_06930 [Steroidobacteraceae bacterium]|nr:hypothetical protein [Steroidobacteraceae bacterium]
MVLDVVNALLGLLNAVLMWRFTLVTGIGAASALFVFFRIHDPVPALVLAVVLFGVSFWIGYRWQSAFEVRRRQSSSNRWSGP